MRQVATPRGLPIDGNDVGVGVAQAADPGLEVGLEQLRVQRNARMLRRLDEVVRPGNRQAEGPQSAASCVSLGVTSADRARATGDRGEIQRDHRHSPVAEAPRSDRCAGHHRCDGDAD